jgi:trigger factor
MQVNLETLEGLERKLSIVVPMALVDTEVQSRLQRLSRTVKMPGFRPGKVPFKVVAQQHGPQVRQEVLGDTLQKSFSEAVAEKNLRVAGYPQFDAAMPAESGVDFEFSAVFEVYPEVLVGDLTQSFIKRVHLDVEESEVDKTLDLMRKQRVSFHAASRPAENGDRVTMDYRGTIDGVEFPGGVAQGQSVVLGDGRFLPDFEKQLPGMSADEIKSFELNFPDDYAGKEVAGKTAVFEVTVKEVAAPQLPEIDSAFAKELGIEDGDLEKMRAEVRGNLEREVRARLKSKVKEQVMEALLVAAPITVPKALIEMEVSRLQDMARQDMAARGMPVSADMPIPADLFEPQAERRVKLGLILSSIVTAQNLQAKSEQVRAAVDEQAQTYDRPEDVVKWYYQSPDRLREIESMVLEENVVQWVLTTAKVEDQAISFDELMGATK